LTPPVEAGFILQEGPGFDRSCRLDCPQDTLALCAIHIQHAYPQEVMQQAPGSLSSYSLLERQELTAHSMPEFATFPAGLQRPDIARP
jgi:hypothetical protein